MLKIYSFKEETNNTIRPRANYTLTFFNETTFNPTTITTKTIKISTFESLPKRVSIDEAPEIEVAEAGMRKDDEATE